MPLVDVNAFSTAFSIHFLSWRLDLHNISPDQIEFFTFVRFEKRKNMTSVIEPRSLEC